MRLAAPCSLATVALGLSACGGPGTSADVSQIRRTVVDFSEASGPRACDYLTSDALEEIFGGGATSSPSDVPRARAACRSRAGSFRGTHARVTRLTFQSPTAATATALVRGLRQSYTLRMQKAGGRWLIQHIAH